MNNYLQLKYFEKINGDLWLVENEAQGLKFSYKIKEVIYEEQSSFQHIMILDSYDYGRMLVLDGIVQTTSRDGYIYNEMISHIPMNIHANPKRVLIIGGGDCGVAREITKYQDVDQIDFVEIDELVVKACLKHLPEVSGNLNDPRVNFIFQDGIKFVENIKNEEDYYDVVIIDSSDPVGPAIPLFGLEFYKNIFNVLNEDGIMVCQSESPIFYLDTLKQTYNRLASLFPIAKVYETIVPTYPGGAWTFTLASKKYSRFVTSKFDKDTRYVNQGILEKCFTLPEYIKRELI